MSGAERFLKSALLRYTRPLAHLRRVPVLGEFLGWAGRLLVPSDTLIWVQIKQGGARDLWIRVNPRTGYGLQQGFVEVAVQRALQECLRPGMTFYDLGANIGFFTLLGARIVGQSGQVFAFEVDPEVAARLRENLARNKFGHVHVEQKAVWSRSTMVPFARVDRCASPDLGLGHIGLNDASHSHVINVDAISLDEFVCQHPAPDFIKCDVEGAEGAVLDGADKLLRERRPILLIEMHSAEIAQRLQKRLRELGYLCRELDESHVLASPS